MLLFLKCGAKVIGYFEICNIFAKKISKMDKIIGLGNALTDVLAIVKSDEILADLKLQKGCITFVNDEGLLKMNRLLASMQARKVPGGSAGNSIRAMARLNVPVGFIGKVGTDDNGAFYRESLSACGVDTHLLVSADLPSGVASTFISPDGERTFADYLGAASSLKAEELMPDMFKGYTYLLIEGYLVQDHDMILRAIELAKEAGLQVCMDLASPNVVRDDRDFFSLLINKYVDIVFANEEEARAFTGKEPEEALDVLGGLCSVAVVKLGARGSLLRKGTETVHVEAVAVEKVVDTTGAGDYFAAGFLYGLTCGYALEKCARIGSLLSGHIIQVIGAELSPEEWKTIKNEL